MLLLQYVVAIFDPWDEWPERGTIKLNWLCFSRYFLWLELCPNWVQGPARFGPLNDQARLGPAKSRKYKSRKIKLKKFKKVKSLKSYKREEKVFEKV